MRPGEYISVPTMPQTAVLAYRKDFFNHSGEKADFRKQYGRALAPAKTWEELHEVAKFFTRKAGETVAGKVLEYPLYGYGDSMRYPAGAGRSFLIFFYSLGLDGFDENFIPDVDHPILVDASEFLLKVT